MPPIAAPEQNPYEAIATGGSLDSANPYDAIAASPAPAQNPYEPQPKPAPGKVNPAAITPDQAITLSAQADCSLFTQRTFDKAGVKIPRTAIQQFRATPMVLNQGQKDFKALQPGDLIFFDNGRRTPFNTHGKAVVGSEGDVQGYVNHVGIYQGNGVVTHDRGDGTVATAKLADMTKRMTFMGATRPLNQKSINPAQDYGGAASEAPPLQSGHGGPSKATDYYTAETARLTSEINKAQKSGDTVYVEGLKASLNKMKTQGRDAYNHDIESYTSGAARDSEMARQGAAAQDAYLKRVYGKSKADLLKEDPEFFMHGVDAANATRARMSATAGKFIEPVTTAINRHNPLVQSLYGVLTPEQGKALDAQVANQIGDLATSPLRPLIAAGGVPEDAAKGPLQGVYALGQFVLESAAVELGSGPFGEAVSAVAKPVLKIGGQAAVKMGQALQEVAIRAKEGPSSAAFVKALRAAQSSGVDLEALAGSIGKDGGNYKAAIQRVARTAGARPTAITVNAYRGSYGDPAAAGSHGVRFFSDNARTAGDYGPNVINESLTFHNPLVVTGDEARRLTGKAAHPSEMLTQEEYIAVRQKTIRDARAAGHDGLVIRPPIGPEEYWDMGQPQRPPSSVSDTTGGMVDLLNKHRAGPTFTSEQFAGLQRESFIAQSWRQRTEGLLNAVQQEIEGTRGAGRKFGPLKRELQASLDSGVPHPSIKAELSDIWDRQNPAATTIEAPPAPATVAEAPKPTVESPTPAAQPQSAPQVNMGFDKPPATEPAPARTRASAEPTPEPAATEELNRPRKADIDAARDRLGYGEYSPEHVGWDETATKAVRDGHVRNALSEASTLAPKRVTREHIAGWGIRFQQVERELQSAMANGDEAAGAALDHEGETLLNAISAANSEAGRRLASANMLLKDEYGRFALRVKGRKAVGGRELNAAEQAPLDTAAQQVAANQAKEQEIINGKAQSSMDQVASAAAKNGGSKPRILVSEETYRKALKDLATTDLSAGLPLKQAVALAKIAGYHLETLARSGGKTVHDVLEALKRDAPGFSDAHYMQALDDAQGAVGRRVNAGRAFGESILTEGKAAISDADIAGLRRELDQMKAEFGKIKGTPAEGLITKLRNQVKQLEGMRGKPVDLEGYRKLRASIGETSRQLNAGRGMDETLLTQGKAGVIDPEIAELRKSTDKIKMEADRHIAALKAAEDYSNLSTLGKGRAQLQDLMNAPRTIKASIDFSAPLRQGIFFSVTHPGLTVHSLPTMFTSFGSKGAYEDLMAAMRSSEHFDLAMKSKLFIADAEAPLLLDKSEEMFASRAAGYVPGVKASERAYAAFLNKQRFDMFSHYANAAIDAGKPLTEAEAASVANFINVATGRGTGKIADAAAGLGQAFFAPRYTVSRFQLALGSPLWKSISENGLASTSTKIIAKEYAKFYGTALTTVGALKWAGVNIGIDPRSTDFGKIVIGNSRIDIFGGMQQPIRLIAQLTRGRVDKNGVWTPPSPSEAATILGRFLIQKENPMLSAPFQLLTGKDLVGGDYDAKRAIVDLLSPLSIQQGWDSLKEEGPWVGGMMILADVFGAATNIQEPKSTPLGAPYTAQMKGDQVLAELGRIGYAHPLPRYKTETGAEYDKRRRDFQEFVRPDVELLLRSPATSEHPAFKDLTKKEKQIELQELLEELTKQYNKGPGTASYDKESDAEAAKVQAEIDAQRKMGAAGR